MRAVTDLRDAAFGRNTGKCLEGSVVIAGTAIAFLLGYSYVAAHPLQGNWAQTHMGAAVNYACTGRFGPIRLAQDATSADAAALEQVKAFMNVAHLNFSCSLFPQHVVDTSFFDGIDAANTEHPIYLMVLYGLLWHWFGLHWSLTFHVIGATVAVSFLLVYLCARPFMPVLVAAGVTLLFLFSPLFIPNVLSPRDALKFPFAVGIAALLIAAVPSPRSPYRFVFLASCTGLIIGVGYGFRSDLLLFLLPAMLIMCFVSQAGLSGVDWRRRASTHLAVRLSAVAALLTAFAVGGSLPLLNDYYLHPSYADVGFHPMAMGLLGTSKGALFQSHALDGGMYMFRATYGSDLAAGVRILEYASRKFGENVDFAAGRYWTHSRHFYFDVVSHIPADLVSGAIGAFVSLMTLPNRHGSVIPFAANLLVVMFFLVRITRKFRFRSAIATTIVFGTVLAVTSLKFELRHMFYIYVFAVLAWGSAIALLLHALIFRADIDLEPAKPGTTDRNVSPRQAARLVAALFIVVCIAVFATLWAARAYQANVLHRLIVDLTNRSRVTASYEISDIGSGRSLIRALSPMPLSTGGQRAIDALAANRVEMGVVVIDFDGKLCADRLVTATAVSQPVMSNPHPDVAFVEMTYALRETFSIAFRRAADYVVFLPAFSFSVGDADGNTITVRYSGVELDNASVECVKSVSFLSEFKKTDILFDFFVPADPSALTRDDLFQRVKLPGLGYI